MSNIRIRNATPADVPVILELIRELAEYEQLLQFVTATEERLRQTLFGPKPAAEAVLADLEGECAGFALFFSSYSTFRAQPGIYLEDLYVKQHLRGRRVGSALLRHLAALAIERGCARLDWSVLNWNEPSIRFYEMLGAKPLSDWTSYRLSGEALEQLAAKATPRPAETGML
jgi:GNAT superfamily N-acetyltransferase